ncbi:uncharacterized protein LOC127084377 isoform X7 [Lathyrus oleraceus]|uniref:uncharacterized protein LOC127084377 isoform X7 n=1 Tax=Pisum sativum TaxID=3888 RepID=UPI0021D1423F|nr:uncharacterized protein LOC127084377 isoform X7 [Pisum sativum]
MKREIKLKERGPEKDKNWRNFNKFYTHCNTRWAERNMFLIKKDLFVNGPLMNYAREGDVDEIETEEPIQENTSPISTCIPRCNFLSPTPQDASTSTPECSFRLPTPRDEVSKVQVQTPFFDSSLSHEALSIQTPQEVLSPRCLHSLRYFYL